MTQAEYPSVVYRAPSSKTLRQGDIAFCEFSQLRPRSGERPGPGPASVATPELPTFGPYEDYAVDVPQPGGEITTRVVRVWSGFVVVVQQNCEIVHASSDDSRLLAAPLVGPGQWPEGPWEWLRENRLPSYMYLPGLEGEAALEYGLEENWSECVAALASMTLVSRALVRPRRVLSLSQEMLPHLQEKVSRCLTTRGFAAGAELEGLVGKRVMSAHRTDETVLGPSRLWKLFLGEQDSDDGDDEISVTLGSRP